MNIPYQCAIAAFPGICQICQPPFVVTPSYQCLPYQNGTCNVTNCFICNNTNFCSECNPGYTVQVSNGTCIQQICNISFCITCASSTTCNQC